MSETATFPGDKIASIEEYEAGYNTFDDGDMVRASTVGEKNLDKTTRVASIKHPKMLSIPKVGDIVIGTVAAAMSSVQTKKCLPSCRLGAGWSSPRRTRRQAIPSRRRKRI